MIKTFWEKLFILLGLFSSHWLFIFRFHVSTSPGSTAELRLEAKCLLHSEKGEGGREGGRKRGKKRRRKGGKGMGGREERQTGACFTHVDAFCYYPRSCCLCSFDQTLADNLFKLRGHLKVLETPMDRDDKLGQFHLPLFQH